MDHIEVLDHGYVRLVDVMGTDLSVVNAARVSFDKEAHELLARDKSLLNFLGREGHTSPFRHAMLSFEVYAPLMVARQWWKYVVGSDHTMDGWNESSRRYVTEEPTFYLPDQWRSAPQSRKQGSGEPLDEAKAEHWTAALRRHQEEGHDLYRQAMADGVTPEQARLFLSAYGLYVRWRWAASLQTVCHFVSQRLADDAQWEIRAFAQAVLTLSKERFPWAISAYLGEER